MYCTQEDWDYAESAHNRMDDYMEIQEHTDIVDGIKQEVCFNAERIAFMLTGLIEYDSEDLRKCLNDLLEVSDSNLEIDNFRFLIERTTEENPFTKAMLQAVKSE